MTASWSTSATSTDVSSSARTQPVFRTIRASRIAFTADEVANVQRRLRRTMVPENPKLPDQGWFGVHAT